jgi:hypothetical protein
MAKRKPGEATTVVPKRFAEEDDLLAAIRDVHVRLQALFEREDLRAWLLGDRPELAEQTIQELREAERLFYQLRAGRAIEVGQANEEGQLVADRQ